MTAFFKRKHLFMIVNQRNYRKMELTDHIWLLFPYQAQSDVVLFDFWNIQKYCDIMETCNIYQ